ncbi:NADH-UBIQUINONE OXIDOREDUCTASE, NQO3 SUBUNIT NQO3 [Wolinella succinogenes]|uniref:NADH-UBIQUINONE OXIDOREDUCTASE, NQO3 SUBUNIT NQO3 n=1 Tax=Wolinella succinogenes (strain ATCC 29543 / DSM 1740 / CCUG 13145 / JCM 31913 / LMG 7466 / NCTC 11488 / FDC 602W) TaxID=273121 RepID=Q7MA44_WOLSU|nr:NADH-UBIQUINONE OXIDOREDUCTASE, NQO3 SUBUNIT NQO3 [Wolinella succinogenes]VEG81835.1 NADH dehydrogenase subunit G [Wolinella succinogenes]
MSASDFILTLGGSIRHEAPVVKYAINNALKMNKGSSLLCLHPLKDKAMENLGKNVTSLSYAPLKEEQAVAWLLQAALPREILRGSFLEYLEGKERWTSVEIPAANEGEEPTKEERYESLLASALGWEFDLRTSLTQASSPILVIGADLYAHPRATNIARMLGILQKHSAIKILLTPPSTNTLGVALLCDLDEEKGEYTIGYNTQGDFILSSLPERAHLLMPALNQQEGTFTNIDKRVIPLHPALPYEGYELNDIAKALGLKEEHTIHYTPLLPKEKGFLEVAFDSLPNHYENDGSEKRGYELAPVVDGVKKEEVLELEIPKEREDFKANAYARNPESQFSPWSARSSILQAKAGIYASSAMMESLGMEAGEELRLEGPEGSLTLPLYLDASMEGEFLAVSIYEHFGEAHPLFPTGYPFSHLSVKKAKS